MVISFDSQSRKLHTADLAQRRIPMDLAVMDYLRIFSPVLPPLELGCDSSVGLSTSLRAFFHYMQETSNGQIYTVHILEPLSLGPPSQPAGASVAACKNYK